MVSNQFRVTLEITSSFHTQQVSLTCETSNILQVSSCSFGLDAVVSVRIRSTIFGLVSLLLAFCTHNLRQWSYFPFFRLYEGHPPTVQPLH